MALIEKLIHLYMNLLTYNKGTLKCSHALYNSQTEWNGKNFLRRQPVYKGRGGVSLYCLHIAERD